MKEDRDKIVKKLYDRAIHYEGGEPSGLLVQAGDTIILLTKENQELKAERLEIINKNKEYIAKMSDTILRKNEYETYLQTELEQLWVKWYDFLVSHSIETDFKLIVEFSLDEFDKLKKENEAYDLEQYELVHEINEWITKHNALKKEIFLLKTELQEKDKVINDLERALELASQEPMELTQEAAHYNWLDNKNCELQVELDRVKEIIGLVKELFDMLDTIEESDSGRKFKPTNIETCRVMHSIKLKKILPSIKTLINKS